MSDNIDIELLIEEVKKFSELWDNKCENYHDKTQKQSAWTSIFTTFYPDYEDKTQKEKEDIGNQVINKWRNVRDAFMKKRKKVGKQYIYARQLSFLLNNTSVEDSIGDLTDDIKPSTPMSTESCSLSTPLLPRKNQKLCDNFAQTEELSEMKNMGFPPNESEKPIYYDSLFFESLLPFMKDIPKIRKLRLRNQIQDLILSELIDLQNEDHNPPSA